MLQELYHIAKDLIYENRCAVCRTPTHTAEIVCKLCNPINTLLPHSQLLIPPYCVRCGESLQIGSNNLCQNCNLYPLAIRYIRSIWAYTDTAESLICAYKYGNSRSLATFLAAVSASAIQSGIYPPEARYNWNLILPLPSTYSTLRQREFSPVGKIVKSLSVNLNLPFSSLALEAVGNHPPQASLSPVERLKHIKAKFRASSRLVSEKKVLLVDDVITSGASLIGSAVCLLEAGAESVDALSLCRSELFSQLRREIFRII